MKKKPMTFRIAKIVSRIFFKIVYPYDLVNGYSIPDDKTVIVCSNHLSNIDPFLINATQTRLVHFMAKKELFENPILGFIIRGCGAFPVDRGHDGGKAVNTAEELLNDNNCLGIFLEGTRSKTGEFGKPHSGAVRIAYATKRPIMPCCITGKNTLVKPFRRVKITFGEPLSCEELGLIEGTMKEYRAANAILMQKIAELREQQMADFNKKRKNKS